MVKYKKRRAVAPPYKRRIVLKKLIIKTAAITLAVIVAAAFAVYGALAAFSPKTLAEFYDKAGNAGLAREFYARNYDKTGDINDLYVVCVKADEKGDAARAAKYLGLITKREDFNEFCDKKDAGYTVKISTALFLQGKCVAAEYYYSGVDKAVEQAVSFNKGGYAENNAFTLFISSCVKDFSATDRAAVKSALESVKTALTDAEDVARAESDIAAVAKA